MTKISAFAALLCISLLASLPLASSARANDYYQIGSQWDKQELFIEDLAQAGPSLQKAARALGRMGGSTAFYLGKFNGRHLMANNNHDHPNGCQDDMVTFPYLGNRQFRCLRMVGTWPHLDLTIFPIEVPADMDQELQQHALRFAFHRDVYPGQRLVTIGYGHHRNPGLRPVYDQGPDCMVLSPRNEFRLQQDTDPHYSNIFSAWSFANGCEASQGDSGSAILDRQTGEVVGVLWTSTPGKPARVQNTAYLNQLLAQPTNLDIWTQLNYAVAAPKIYEVLTQEANVATSQLGDDNRAILRALLQQ